MDAGKAVAFIAASPDVTPETVFFAPVTRALPIVAVPTTAGTGSEVTQYAILTNDAEKTKTSLASPVLFPAAAFLDARYTAGLGLETTVNTAVDALSHAVEGMLSVRASAFSDAAARGALGLLAGCMPALAAGKAPPEVRARLQDAATLAGLVIANTGTTAVHALGYSLTYFKHVDHGRANGLTLASYLGFNAARDGARVNEILAALGMREPAALADALCALLGGVRPSERLSADEVTLYAQKAMTTKNIQNCTVVPTEGALTQVLKISVGG
jgi:alcohol dehydrogenase class IV